MNHKQLTINLSSNMIALFVSVGITFILTPYLINSIGKVEYSFFPLANNFIGYMSIISLALNSMVARFVTIEMTKNNISLANKYYASSLYANLMLIAILSIPMFIIVQYIEKIINIPPGIIYDVKILFSLVFLSMLFDLLSSVFSVSTFSKNRLDLRALSEISKSCIKLFLYLFLFFFYKPTVIFVGIIAISVSLVNLIIQYFFSKNLLPEFNISLDNLSFSILKKLISSGSWNVVNSLGVSFLLGMNLLLTNYYLGSEYGGTLSISLMLPAFISSVISMIVSVLLPRLTAAYGTGDDKNIQDEFVLSQKILSILTTIPISSVIIFGKEFYSLWLPLEYTNEVQILSVILLFPLLIYGNVWTVYSMNIVLNKVKIPSLFLLIVGFISFILSNGVSILFDSKNIIYIPLITSTLSVLYYLFFIPCYTLSQLNLKKTNVLLNIYKPIIFSVVYIVSWYFIKDYIHIYSWCELVMWTLLSIIIGMVLHCFVIFSLKEIYIFTSFIKTKIIC
ncbi:oligosaccharide flippase family protein [Photobacterium damselae]|uniref:oligosaccharide flippase family protein n=1 Tax=Photobacterium damselae TaxID=38293 RepID=UPI000D8590F7|nr:oligosaccharide flippase family protein [Photobacterium damselae]NVO72625.1 oligosaccharide flippase family protein [Photobacterium damselae subsp. damselae]SPY22958.1 Polysaccharide biosynthesis protein [Photobacterium damselae]